MTTIVVLFNLKSDADVAAYEAWAKSTDVPMVNALGSVDEFRVQRATGLLGSDQAPPYQYVELIEVPDMEAFGADVASDTVQRVAGEFQQFADAPMFITTEAL
jgi:hypothetical protein